MRPAWHQPYACQVVKSRASRMGLADMVRGLAILAQRLYPELGTQAAAFHRLLSDHLLPWMLQLEAALVECQLGAPPLGLLFERHAPFTQLVFDTYLAQPARPLSPAVAALPMQLLQWPQLVAFAQDFELCPALLGWSQLARQFCFVGTCAVPQQWQRPEVHSLTPHRSPVTLTPHPSLLTLSHTARSSCFFSRIIDMFCFLSATDGFSSPSTCRRSCSEHRRKLGLHSTSGAKTPTVG